MAKYLFILLTMCLTGCGMKTKQSEEEQNADGRKFSNLVWFDEFDGNNLDLNKWTPVVGDGCPEFCGFGNNELQYYSRRPENLKVKDGVLVIKALQDSLGSRAYSSAKLVTKEKGDWKYGRIEVRAKLPEGRGTWSAIWMLPTLDRDMKWPLDGEIDVMEHVGYNQGTVFGTIHTQLYNHISGTQKSDSVYRDDVSRTFHTYALEWDETSLSWFVDDEKFLRIEKEDNEPYEGWPFDQNFHLILNVAVGGNWGGKHGIDDEIWPQQMEVDYVRVYQE